MAKKLQLLSVVISRQCLLRALHVEDVEEKVWVLVFELIVKWSAIDTEVGNCLGMQVLLEH